MAEEETSWRRVDRFEMRRPRMCTEGNESGASGYSKGDVQGCPDCRRALMLVP